MSADRKAFTLVELLVAMVLGVAILAGARSLLDGVSLQGQAIDRAAATSDEQAAADRTARQLAWNLDLARDTTPSFAGDVRGARFASWCPDAYGTVSACVVRLEVRGTPRGDVPILLTSSGYTIALHHATAHAGLLYLAAPEDGEGWRTDWPASLVTPRAIAVVASGDTIVLRVGGRR